MGKKAEENEAEKIVEKILDYIRKNKELRKAVVYLVFLVILAVTASFIYKLIPRKYSISVTGGEILFYQHYLATLVRDEVSKLGVNLVIQPTSGSFDALRKVSEGELDMAFVQGGLEKRYPGVHHVATLQPEALHILVKPEITSVSDLRGKVVNLGSLDGGTWVIAKKVLEFSGLLSDVDYAEMNRTNERVVGMRRNKLPDAVAVISCIPSYVAEFLVKERGYRVLEIPFPKSLALRFGWVAEVEIPDYTYNVIPPVPEKPLKTIGVNMQLVANEKTPPEAVEKILTALFQPSIENKTHYNLKEEEITQGANFPISQGTTDYLARNDPLVSMKTYDTISNAFGLLMSVLSGFLVVRRWLADEEDSDHHEKNKEEKETEEKKQEA